MARRRKSTGADVFFNLASRLPWWACLGIAAVGYFVLHGIASTPLKPIVPGRVGETIYPAMFHGVAAAGQYIVPILFVAAAIGSLIRTKFGKTDDEIVSRPQATARPVRKASAPAVACPECGGAMVHRSAKRGANAGNMFWGCSNYPRCKGTRAIP